MIPDDFTMEDFIRFWARAALVLVFIEAYLTVNKIWIRKHEPVVADSVSVSAQFLAIVTGLPFVALFSAEGAYEGAISEAAFLAVNAIMIMIGTGLWVRERRGVGFWRNLRRSLSLESSEATALVNDVFRPVGADRVVRILYELALIDSELDARELALIQSFADRWGVDLALVLPGSGESEDGQIHGYMKLRRSVRDYLAMSPPAEQAGQLRDLLSALVLVDDKTSDEETLVMEELNGLIDGYVTGSVGEQYNVLIAPQSDQQEHALSDLLPDLHKENRLGGEVFVVGRYYSHAYAEVVCAWYREAGFLTVSERDAGS